MSGHTPMVVTATLETGIAHAGPWGIALDGLLAAQLHDRAKTHLGDLRVRIDKALTTAESPVPGGGGDA